MIHMCHQQGTQHYHREGSSLMIYDNHFLSPKEVQHKLRDSIVLNSGCALVQNNLQFTDRCFHKYSTVTLNFSRCKVRYDMLAVNLFQSLFYLLWSSFTTLKTYAHYSEQYFRIHALLQCPAEFLKCRKCTEKNLNLAPFKCMMWVVNNKSLNNKK